MGREESLAGEFERLAADLRSGEANLYGYDVDPDTGEQSGGIDHSRGWVYFELKRETE